MASDVFFLIGTEFRRRGTGAVIPWSSRFGVAALRWYLRCFVLLLLVELCENHWLARSEITNLHLHYLRVFGPSVECMGAGA